jgi:D-glycero-D-manno-heptose 1,7-bisphosphate phosphatase
MNKAVFLDRDGVLNRSLVVNGKPYPPQDIAEFEILPGVADGLALFKSLGFLCVVVTNQPDVRTGKQSLEKVESFHRFLRQELPIDDVKVCYHISDDGCVCRKPKPGMLVEAADELGISLSHSVMIGDRWRDIEAGESVGCRCFLVDYNYPESNGRIGEHIQRVSGVLDVAKIISGET